jgi:hypothetical protein
MDDSVSKSSIVNDWLIILPETKFCKKNMSSNFFIIPFIDQKRLSGFYKESFERKLTQPVGYELRVSSSENKYFLNESKK